MQLLNACIQDFDVIKLTSIHKMTEIKGEESQNQRKCIEKFWLSWKNLLKKQWPRKYLLDQSVG